MYKHKASKPTKTKFDVIIIGTGAGGGVAAHQAAASGKSVAVVEDTKIGGECPNFGCVPTKALLQAAEAFKMADISEQFGVQLKASVDYPKVKAWKDLAVKRTGTSEGEDLYNSEGITVIKGHAHFLDKWTLAIGKDKYKAHRFIIATGTKSVIPPIPGLKEAGFITYREAISLDKLPKSLFIIGGGAIGCEFAELFSSFGVQVTIVDGAPRLVAAEDPEVGELLAQMFAQKGISVHAGSKVTRVEKSGANKVVHFETDGKTHQATVEEILVASGKAPNTDLGLENAGVAYDRGGIKVDKYLRTTAKHIYAAGDVVGPYRFTHTASYQSRVAIHNMLHNKGKTAVDYHAVPRCVFVDPEIASVGMSEQQLKEKKIPYKAATVPVNIIGRANTSNVEEGFVKVIMNKRGVLVGAAIVSPRAGEMIHELTLAVQHKMTPKDIVDTIHAFPTWSEAVKMACRKVLK